MWAIVWPIKPAPTMATFMRFSFFVSVVSGIRAPRGLQLFARRPAGKPYEKFKEKDSRFLRTECCAMTTAFVISTTSIVVVTKTRKSDVNGDVSGGASGAARRGPVCARKAPRRLAR
jgi:hypothetical protein